MEKKEEMKITDSRASAKEVAIQNPTELQKTPFDLIRDAVNSGVDLDKLERLLLIQKDWEANEARKAYHEAMANFKADPPQIHKDKKVNYTTSKGNVAYSHATLGNVTQKINAQLSKYGLSSSFGIEQNGQIKITCKITHCKGHSEETSLLANKDDTGSKNSIQALGSTMSYLERYTLLALTGLATMDQDDDGQASEKPIEYITEAQISELTAMLDAKNLPHNRLFKALKVESLDKIPVDRYKTAKSAIESAKAVAS